MLNLGCGNWSIANRSFMWKKSELVGSSSSTAAKDEKVMVENEDADEQGVGGLIGRGVYKWLQWES